MLLYTITRPRSWLVGVSAAFGILGLLAVLHMARTHEQCVAAMQMQPHLAPPLAELEHESVWCTDESRCFVDLAALEREHMPMPRGLRLVPNGEGLRIDGARGLLARLDLRNGDVLRAVDETPLLDGADLTALQPAIARGEFVLHVRRGGEDLRKHITIVSRPPA